MVTTLTGPAAVLGQQLRDGSTWLSGPWQQMGARKVEVVIADDELKPDVAITKIKGLIEISSSGRSGTVSAG